MYSYCLHSSLCNVLHASSFYIYPRSVGVKYLAANTLLMNKNSSSMPIADIHTHTYIIERLDPIYSGRFSILGIAANPTMRKAAALIIFE